MISVSMARVPGLSTRASVAQKTQEVSKVRTSFEGHGVAAAHGMGRPVSAIGLLRATHLAGVRMEFARALITEGIISVATDSKGNSIVSPAVVAILKERAGRIIA